MVKNENIAKSNQGSKKFPDRVIFTDRVIFILSYKLKMTGIEISIIF